MNHKCDYEPYDETSKKLPTAVGHINKNMISTSRRVITSLYSILLRVFISSIHNSFSTVTLQHTKYKFIELYLSISFWQEEASVDCIYETFHFTAVFLQTTGEDERGSSTFSFSLQMDDSIFHYARCHF